MTDLDAIMLIESPANPKGSAKIMDDGDDGEAIVAAYQQLLDSGTIWKLQGSYVRMAYALLEAGEIFQPEEN